MRYPALGGEYRRPCCYLTKLCSPALGVLHRRAVQRLGTNSPAVIWRETIDRISRLLHDTNDADIEARRRIRYSNLKRKLRFISMRIVCLNAEVADAIAATNAGGALPPTYDLARISRERATLATAACRVQSSILMIDKRLHADMQREADALRFESVPSNAGRIAKALRDADYTPSTRSQFSSDLQT